jgi:glycosyltransferase involved in cell wall biosynthesis
MKILHIYKDYYPVMGGIENYVKTLAEFQRGQGHDVTVLATSPSGKTTLEMINGVRVIKSARIANISSTPLSFSLFKWIRRLVADITHLHFPYPVGEFAHLFLGRSSHTVITYHSDIVKQKLTLRLYMPFLRLILKKADRVLATSPQYIETSPYLNAVKDKCVVVPLGTDISRFQRPDKRMSSAIRKENGNSFILLFVGRLRYFKGLKYLVEAMKSVDGKLLIIGTGPEEKALKEKVMRDKLDGKVTFLGDVSDEYLPAYYDACDVFILPSSHRSEAFGTVLIEAMASGKPVISSELGTGTSYVNIHGLTGLVVPPKDPASLAGAIYRLSNDDSLRREFAQNAAARAEEFTNDVLNRRVLEVYEQVLNAPSGTLRNRSREQEQI